MSSFLSSRSISAVVDGATSSSFTVNSCVLKGSVLSPTLFLLFINDLLTCTSYSIHSYVADSTLILQLILFRFPLFLPELPLVLIFLILFSLIWIEFQGGEV